YLLSGEINDYSKLVFFSPEKFYSEKGVKVLINHFVKSVNARLKKIEVIDRRTNHTLEMEYDKLILTTGSIPNEIPELPYTLENVFSYKSVSDYLKLKSYLDKNNVEKILIIGSGYIGLEVAENLAAKKIEVTIFDKEELPLPSAELEIRHLIKSIIDENKIPFLTKENYSKFIVRNNKFAQLKHEGRYLDFDLAIVAAGIKPNIYLAESAKLKIGKYGGLIVDSRLKTSDPNIYAAGDNIEVTNKITNRADYFPLATYAHNYGHIAGENAAGGNQIAEAIILNSSFKFFNKFIAQVGLNFEQAVKHNVNAKFITSIANNKVKIMHGSSKVFGKIVYDRYSKLILGASFIGSNEVSGYADLISSFIYNKNTVLNLAKINYNYTPPLSPFINLLSILGRKIQETI
ncbi:MAG: FAD-dependent oxidoreductase, partial [Ignavibacteriae bacterium]|nr:FAD-dependent oxidoreductase [Ignavibacteriota bacterium]